MNDLGKLLIVLGVGIALAGVVLLVMPRVPWLGRLPGDIHVSGGNVRFFAPVVSMVIISVVLTVVLNIFLRLR